MWGGIVALLNDARLEAGKPPMGYTHIHMRLHTPLPRNTYRFINPWLYSLEGALTDVTTGNNKGRF